jgi:hypothetical protein
MSEQETHKGKMTKMDMPLGLTKEEQMLWLKNEGVEFDTFYPECDNYWTEQAIVIGDTVYKVEDDELEDSGDFFNIEKNEDGSYSYFTSFYNGGTCLQEMLEDGLKEK